MPIAFRHVRVKTIAPFVADPDPNVTPPAASAIFQLATQTKSILVSISFETPEVPAAKADFKIWIRDRYTNAWHWLPPVSKFEHRRIFPTDELQGHDAFVQVTNLYSPGAATQLFVRAHEAP